MPTTWHTSATRVIQLHVPYIHQAQLRQPEQWLLTILTSTGKSSMQLQAHQQKNSDLASCIRSLLSAA